MAGSMTMKLLIEPVWNRNFYTYSIYNTLLQYLLIEPVWNRNVSHSFRFSDTYHLLIEPVWNRNQVFDETASLHGLAFNRTSMESKQVVRLKWAVWRGYPAFNRTSMESKLIKRPSQNQRGILLIEPVWNRN